jgi:large subunit ribosomal protein L10
MPKPQKISEVEELTEAIREAGNFYLVEFTGLSVTAMSDLRGKILDAGGRMRVAKNTLLTLAFRALGVGSSIETSLVGPTAILLCVGDPVSPAKAVFDFGLTLNKGTVVLKAGWVEGDVLDARRAESMAKLPGQLEIKSMLVGALVGPLQGVVGAMSGVTRDLVYTLEAVADKRKETEPSPAPKAAVAVAVAEAPEVEEAPEVAEVAEVPEVAEVVEAPEAPAAPDVDESSPVSDG